MSNSARYKSLTARLSELQKNLIPPTSPTGSYTVQEQDQIRAFKLLVHAEFEAFFEDRAAQICSDALSGWQLDGRPRRSLISLLAYETRKVRTPRNLAEASREPLRTRLESAVAKFNQRLRKSNNGIMEDNLMKILLPIGIQPFEIDDAWINSMSSYGKERGAAAHRAIHVQASLDPVSEVATALGLLKGIGIIDEIMEKL